MQVQRLIICSIFFVLSLFLFFFPSKVTFFTALLASVTMPVQEATYRQVALASSRTDLASASVLSLQERIDALQKENSALRDQFATTVPTPSSLLPCQIIGMPRFLPGVSHPVTLILDCGGRQGVKTNLPVVVKDILIGKIAKVTVAQSLVTLLTDSSISFTAVTKNSGALGIVAGQNNGKMILQNVELSDKLQIGDIVITKGSEDSNGDGFPPNLIVGTIAAVNKVPSALFQSASINAPVDIAKLESVFVVKNR